jgi:hypothetical protein
MCSNIMFKNELKIFNFFLFFVIINIKIFSILRKNGAHLITKKNVWQNIYCSHLFWTCKKTFKTSSISIIIEHLIFQKYKIIVLSTTHNSVEWFFEFKRTSKTLKMGSFHQFRIRKKPTIFRPWFYFLRIVIIYQYWYIKCVMNHRLTM